LLLELDELRTLVERCQVRPLTLRASTDAALGLAKEVPALFDALCDTDILRSLREVRWTWLKEEHRDSSG
jgi:hypothetical protein